MVAGISNEMISGCYKPLGGFAYNFKTQDMDVSVGASRRARRAGVDRERAGG